MALEYTPIDFTLVHVNGVHKTWVVFCQCPEKPGDCFQNSLESWIFPATRNKLRMGFTFAVLRDFHLHTLTSKKSSYNYIEAVKRQGKQCISPRLSGMLQYVINGMLKTNHLLGCVLAIHAHSENMDSAYNEETKWTSSWNQ